ncbi:MAG TPA: Gfo/Idh/MocA family oxidoreductase [Vicinamibacterales bacterium]|jgi:predicted dehydrogenase
MRGAIVGFGEVARHGHWPAYARCPDVSIAAVVDRTEERRALARSLVPGVATFETLDELAAAVAIDFVDICTPPALHPQPMLEAIARGWHVLCEKPFVLDPIVLERVRTGAVAAGVAVLPVHNWKFAPIIRNATRRYEAGLIGRLRLLDIEVSRLQAAPTADAVHASNWRRDPGLAGGGILMDHGWHAVYLALHWFQQSPVDVNAWCHRPTGGVEDEAEVMLTFPEGTASIHLTWNGEVRRNRIRLTGDQGEIFIDDDTLTMSGGLPPVWLKMPRALSAGSHHDDWFSAMLPGVLEAFHRPEQSRADFDEAAECLAIIQQAYGRDAMLRLPAR